MSHRLSANPLNAPLNHRSVDVHSCKVRLVYAGLDHVDTPTRVRRRQRLRCRHIYSTMGIGKEEQYEVLAYVTADRLVESIGGTGCSSPSSSHCLIGFEIRVTLSMLKIHLHLISTTQRRLNESVTF